MAVDDKLRCFYGCCFLVCFGGLCFTSYWISEHTKMLALLSPSNSRTNKSVYVQQRQMGDHVVSNTVNNSPTNIKNNIANNNASKSANNIEHTKMLEVLSPSNSRTNKSVHVQQRQIGDHVVSSTVNNSPTNIKNNTANKSASKSENNIEHTKMLAIQSPSNSRTNKSEYVQQRQIGNHVVSNTVNNSPTNIKNNTVNNSPANIANNSASKTANNIEHTKMLALQSPSNCRTNKLVHLQQRQIGDHVVSNTVNNGPTNIKNNTANNSASKSENNIEHTKMLALQSPSNSRTNKSEYVQQRQIGNHVVSNTVNNTLTNIKNNIANNNASKSANNIGRVIYFDANSYAHMIGVLNPDDSRDQRSLNLTLSFLLDIYECNKLIKHPPRFADGVTGNKYLAGPSGEVYYNCSKSCSNCLTVQMPCNNCTTSATECKECIHPTPETCYRKFVDRCATSKHKVTKVLRLDTVHAGYLLHQHKNLKLIQIFRDPRGSVNSRHLCGWYYGGHFTMLKDAEVLCNRIEKDLASAEYLMRLFPGRVKILQYEDFRNSYKVATSLYAFLDMGLKELTRSLLLTLGTNAKFRPDSFRSKMSWNTIQSIQRTCYKVLERLGLRIFKDEVQFRNNTLDIVPGTLPYALEV